MSSIAYKPMLNILTIYLSLKLAISSNQNNIRNVNACSGHFYT